MTKKSFQELSRHERLYRYRQLAKNALRVYGLENAELKFLQYGENVIYRVDCPDGPYSSGNDTPYVPDRYLLRLHAWDEPEYINSEMIWLSALANSANLPVPVPLRTLDGDYLFKISDPDLGVSRWVTLLCWIDGRKRNKGLRPIHMSALGRMVAELHNYSSSWQPPEGFSRPKWDWDAQLGGSLFDVDRDELIETMPIQFQEPFRIVSTRAKNAMSNLGEGSNAFGLIHADLYPENVLYRSGQACLIDFEDCGYSYWIWDIAVALCTWAWEENWEEMRDAFYKGYNAIRTLPEEQWEQLDLFVATQYATMLLWASAFLANDPGRAAEYVPWRDDSGQRLLQFFLRGDKGRNIMNRQTLIKQYEDILISRAVDLFDLNSREMTAYKSYEGCRNLVYLARKGERQVILRFSYHQDRTLDQIRAELDFINYLAENGVRAAVPLLSRNGEYAVEISIEGAPIYTVCFKKGAGMRVPDNGYRYREGIPLEEYFQNWGNILGQMHRLAQVHEPSNSMAKRPDWFEIHADKLNIVNIVPEEFPIIIKRIHDLLNEIRGLPIAGDNYGLIHGDFNDGNFTVNYENGDISVFDFDDCCYFWYAYELAAAWEGGIGRTMFAELDDRKRFMDLYMENVFEGYAREKKITDECLAQIPLFIKLIQIEEFLHYVQYLNNKDDVEVQQHLNYLMACIEQDLPYMGFFDPIYSPRKPFLLEKYP